MVHQNILPLAELVIFYYFLFLINYPSLISLSNGKSGNLVEQLYESYKIFNSYISR